MLIRQQYEVPPHNFAQIPVGPRCFVIVDADDYEKYSRYHYRLVRSGSCFYPMRRVIRNGKAYNIRLHREIMHTPEGYECHHKNHNTLDCRKCNLENLLPPEHRAAHGKT